MYAPKISLVERNNCRYNHQLRLDLELSHQTHSGQISPEEHQVKPSDQEAFQELSSLDLLSGQVCLYLKFLKFNTCSKMI